MRIKLFFFSVLLFAIQILLAQPKWTYRYTIQFPEIDTAFVRPYLCSVDETGRLYVISSKIVDVNAHNAIWYADSTDMVMKKMIDYDLNGDSDTLTGNLYVLRGIATLKRDVIINGSVRLLVQNQTLLLLNIITRMVILILLRNLVFITLVLVMERI